MIHSSWFNKAGTVSLISFLASASTLRAADDVAKELLAVPMLQAASVGIEIAELRADGSMRVLCAHDAGRALMPASTLKLVSTATALQLCGDTVTVPTTVGITGRVDADGTLQGDLVIRGGGDATLASRYDARAPQTFVDGVVQAVRRCGVKRIAGRIVGDGSLLPDDAVSPDWTWEDLGNYYAAGLYGLNYAANSYRLVLDTSHPGSRPTVLRTEPEVPGLIFDNQLSAENYAFDSAYIYGAPHSARRRIEGAVPHRAATFTIQGDVPDPPLLAAATLRAALVQAGVTVQAGAVSDYTLRQAGQKVPTAVRTLYTHRSAPLSDVARQTNLYSQNLLAEMLMRQVAIRAGRTSSVDARRLVLNHWQRAGLDVRGVRLYDGCGLSPNDRLTAHFLVQLLAHMHSHTTFVNSLAVVGREGTVRNFGSGTRLQGNARLKSGTTKQVVAYAGYVCGADETTYAVAVIVNNYDAKPADVRRWVAQLLVKYCKP